MRDYIWSPPEPEPRVKRYFMLNQGEAIKKKLDEPDAIVHFWDGAAIRWVLVE